MNMKKLLMSMGTVATVTAPLAAVVSCGDSIDYSKTIALVISTKANPYFVELANGAKAEAEKHGYTVKEFVTDDDQVKEAQIIDQIITSGYKSIVLNGLDSGQSATAAKKAIDEGIEVIAVDRKLDDSAQVFTTISSANQKGAQDLAAMAIEELGGNTIDTLFHLQGISGEQNGIDRWAGVQDAITADTSFTVTNTKEARANYDRETARTETDTFMTTSGEVVKWISADNDEMALGAIASIGTKAGTDIIVTGFDGTDDAIAAVKDGSMFGTVEQDAAGIGASGIRAAIEAMSETDFDDIVKGVDTLVDVKIITQETLQ